MIQAMKVKGSSEPRQVGTVARAVDESPVDTLTLAPTTPLPRSMQPHPPSTRHPAATPYLTNRQRRELAMVKGPAIEPFVAANATFTERHMMASALAECPPDDLQAVTDVAEALFAPHVETENRLGLVDAFRHIPVAWRELALELARSIQGYPGTTGVEVLWFFQSCQDADEKGVRDAAARFSDPEWRLVCSINYGLPEEYPGKTWTASTAYEQLKASPPREAEWLRSGFRGLKPGWSYHPETTSVAGLAKRLNSDETSECLANDCVIRLMMLGRVRAASVWQTILEKGLEKVDAQYLLCDAEEDPSLFNTVQPSIDPVFQAPPHDPGEATDATNATTTLTHDPSPSSTAVAASEATPTVERDGVAELNRSPSPSHERKPGSSEAVPPVGSLEDTKRATSPTGFKSDAGTGSAADKAHPANKNGLSDSDSDSHDDETWIHRKKPPNEFGFEGLVPIDRAYRKVTDGSRPPWPAESDSDTVSRSFFEKVVTAFPQRRYPRAKTAFVVVAHAASDLPKFLKGLEMIGSVGGLILKQSARDHATVSLVTNRYECYEATSRSISGPDAVKLLGKYQFRGKNVILLDVGGYFAGALSTHAQALRTRGVVGIVEDTENGHQAYLKVLEEDGAPSPPFPVASVARARLKGCEDFNVGDAMITATDMILRQEGATCLMQMGTVGVIGFGKIGQGIAHHLRQQGRHVLVYDHDPLAVLDADARGFPYTTREELLSDSRVIFCATGNGALNDADCGQLREGVYVVSCTSNEKELRDFQRTLRSAARVCGPNLTETMSGKKVRVLCGGNAVNFTVGGVKGPYIYGVQAAIIMSAMQVMQPHLTAGPDGKAGRPEGRILGLDAHLQGIIAGIWLKTFRA